MKKNKTQAANKKHHGVMTPPALNRLFTKQTTLEAVPENKRKPVSRNLSHQISPNGSIDIKPQHVGKTTKQIMMKNKII